MIKLDSKWRFRINELAIYFTITGFILHERTPIFLSIGTVLFIAHALVNHPILAFRSVLRQLPYVSWFCFYVLIIISGLYSDNQIWYQKDVALKLSCFAIPFGLSIWPPTYERFEWILKYFIIFISIAGVLAFGNYLFNYTEINESILRSKPIPIISGINHIYFSIMLAFSTILLIIKAFDYNLTSRDWRYLIKINLPLNVIFLHVISARTGLISFYVVSFIMVVMFIWQRKKVVQGFITLATLLFLAGFALKFVPSLNNRLINTAVDISKARSKEDKNHYSFSMRVEGLKMGVNVIKNNPILGVGAGDVQDDVKQEYINQNSKMIEVNRVMPHHQFIYSYLAAGILMPILLLLILLVPIFQLSGELKLIYISFATVTSLSWMFEPGLERQIGVCFFVLFSCLINSQKRQLS